MAVNLTSADQKTLLPVHGVRFGAAKAGIRKPDHLDLLVVTIDEGASVAGVFTQNKLCAAPVKICREHLQSDVSIRALCINTGIANAGTGNIGYRNAMEVCGSLANLLKISPNSVLPFSTGVIMEPLPVSTITTALPSCIQHLTTDGWHTAARTIMTTDTKPKGASRQIILDGRPVTITGIAKGSGMIHPNMATMLAFVATDAAVTKDVLKTLLTDACGCSFNSITVDGDTSTNDSFIAIATGKANVPVIDSTDSEAYRALSEAFMSVAVELAQSIIRDGEGATKFITIDVENGKTKEECEQVAFSIAHSPLVKTAFFASDPNLGRILSSIGKSGVPDLSMDTVNVWINGVLVAEKGARAPQYTEEAGQAAMKPSDIAIRVSLGRGDAKKTIWTCDLSYEYVRINADYRS